MEEIRRVKEGLKRLFTVRQGDRIEKQEDHEDWNEEWAIDDFDWL